jgi:hypothetical protein
MKKVVRTPSPAAVAVLRQATALAPKRLKASDGLLPSAAHLKTNPDSDHNTGLAVDLTHDPHKGIDCGDIFDRLKADKRVSYLIFSGRIWSKERGEREYTGPNKHVKHLHISIKEEHKKDTSPWFSWLEKPTYKTADAARIAYSKLKKPKKQAGECTCVHCPVHKKGKK